jgi:hypothetical protein
MEVRTAAGFPASRPDEDVGASSAAAAWAEASRDVGAPGTGTFEEESGKNPRPCLPDGESDLADSTRGDRHEPASHLPV